MSGSSGLDLRDRRFSMGRVVSETAGVVRRNAVAMGAVTVTAALVASMAEAAADRALGITTFDVGRGGWVLHQVIVAIASGIAVGGVSRVAVSDLDGGRAGTGAAFAAGTRLAGPLAGLNVVYGLGVGFASLLLVVPGVMLVLRWFVAAPVRAVEGMTVNEAFARSKELTAGHYGPLFGMLVAYIVFAAAVLFLAGWLADLPGVEADGTAGLAIGVVADAIGNAVVNVVAFGGAAVCYAELRRIHDDDTPGRLASVFA